MAFDFPNSPAEGQVFAPSGGPAYVYHAPAWELVSGGGTYAPVEALAYSGLQINGSMEVSQFNPTPSNIALNNTTLWITDGWLASLTGAGGTGSAGQVAVTATGVELSGFAYCLSLATSSGHSMAGSNDVAAIYQSIEGVRWMRLGYGSGSNRQPVTISFWVYPQAAGTMAVVVRGGGSSYVVDVPVTSSSWQYKSITVPAPTIAWAGFTTAATASITFCFGAGSGLKGAPNTWLTGNYLATASTTNFFAAAGNAMRITGVTVIPGAAAPIAAQSALIMRSYDQELIVCKRYFAFHNSCVMSDYGLSGWNYYAIFPIYPMRTTPTVTVSNVVFSNCGNFQPLNYTQNNISLYATFNADGHAYITFSMTLDARI